MPSTYTGSYLVQFFGIFDKPSETYFTPKISLTQFSFRQFTRPLINTLLAGQMSQIDVIATFTVLASHLILRCCDALKNLKHKVSFCIT